MDLSFTKESQKDFQEAEETKKQTKEGCWNVKGSNRKWGRIKWGQGTRRWR